MTLLAYPKSIRFAVIFGGAGVALLVLFAALRGDAPSDESSVATAQRGDVEVKIVELGELRSADQVTISASNDKQIIWLAPEGSLVKAGDPLVKLASEKYEISTRVAGSALRVAKADLRRARSNLAGRRAVEEQARLEYESLPALAEKGYINASEVEQARLNLEEVRSSTRAYEAAVTAAEAEVERAEQSLLQEARKLAEVSIFAPRDGLVVYATFGPPTDPKKISVGMVPFEGQDLMYLPDTSSMVIDADISEFDLAKVNPGSQALVRPAAYPELEFRGEVRHVSTLARQKISQVTGKPTGLKVFDVTIAVLDADPRLKPGLTATVEILVNRYSDVLYVPLAAVFMDEHEQTIVFPHNGGSGDPRLVEVLDSNDRVAIISSGLEQGEEVLLTPPRPL